MAVILSSRGTEIFIDDADFERCRRHAWCDFFPRGQGPYFHATIDGNTVSIHRFIVGAQKGQLVDHRDRDTTNNRRTNLRICTNQQNLFNRGPKTGSITGIKGVYRKKYGYVSAICINRKQIYLGFFKTANEASEAYIRAARKYHGEFAYV